MTDWTAPKTWSTGDLVSASDLNEQVRDNLLVLKDPATDVNNIDNGSNFTTTSTTFVDVDATEFGATITTQGGDVLVTACFAASTNHSPGLMFRIDVDGTPEPVDDGLCHFNNQGAEIQVVTLVYWVEGLSAGQHTFKLQWKVGGTTTGNLYAGSGSSPDLHPQFSAREVS